VENNKQFNSILDECLEQLLSGQETVEQCLQRYPEYVAELEPLLRTAVIMNKAVDVKPSVDFRAKARYQLQVMMAKSKVPKRTTTFVPRWAIAVCAVMLFVVLGGGTVLAADSTMPGSPLYAVKLVTENVRVKLSGSEEKKVELYAAIADRRVTEMAWLVDNGKTGNLEASARRLNNYYAKINELPLANSSETNMLAGSQAESAPMLTAKTSPVDDTKSTLTTSPAVTTSTVVPTIVVTQPAPVVTGISGNRQMENNPQSDAVNTKSRTQLKNVLMYYAVTHPEKLQKLLDSNKVPEAVKPALRRALWASEHSYQQVIDNLN
jgi:hypothetical protein